MKKHLPLFLVVLLSASAFGDDKDLKEARQRWLHGNYAEARAAYEKLLDNSTTAAPAAIGLSRVLQSKGEYEKALTTVENALKTAKVPADLLARKAELLYTLGRNDQALKAAEAAIQGNKDQFLARWIRGCIWRDRGDIDRADKEFRWFVTTYSQLSDKDMDIKDPELLVLVGLAGCENIRLNIKRDNTLSEQYTFILDEVYSDVKKFDKDYWPGEYQAGMLLLEKYNRGEAAEAFANALKINPNAALVYVGRGSAALQKLDVKEAEADAEKALKINPNLPEALRLMADIDLAVGNVEEAVKELESARKINPISEETLGRLAACRYLMHDQAGVDKLAAAVEKDDPRPGLFYYLLAERLEEHRRFDIAEKYYKKAAELRPRMTGPQNALGLLYMRIGREEEAWKILDAAFDADPFNVRVSNNIRVLKHLKSYKTIKTEHFELRYDPNHDEVLARFLTEYLEQVYRNLAAQFKYEPKNRILFEVFRTHVMFSGRVISLPDLHTIGASTGKIVAMASPHAPELQKVFNWGRVVRHELVHVFNLEQTNFQVPTWFTEGLAVENEGFPRPQDWNQLLLQRVPAGKLVALDNIDMGFAKPKSYADWAMSYCQAQLYVQYIKATYGADAIGKLLDAFRQGDDAAAALHRVCMVDKASFEKGYKEFVNQAVRKIRGKTADKAMSFKELKEAHLDKPDDLDLAGRLAVAHYRRGERADARKLADDVLSRKKNQPQAAWVKYKLLNAAGEAKEALSILQEALDENDPDPLVVGELAKVYFNGNEPDKAVKMYELGHKAEPYDRKWLEGMAKAYADAKDTAKQIEVLKELVPLDADDLSSRRRVAQLLLEASKPAEAEKYAREAMEIDVLDKDAQATLLSALDAQGKKAEAERMKTMFAKGS